MTFSLLILDSTRRHMAAASATKTLCVGASVMALESGVGGVLSQALTRPELRGVALGEIKKRHVPTAAIEQALSLDEGIETRQLAVLSKSGEASMRTGTGCLPYAGGQAGSGFVVIGNLLTGPEVISVMVDTFREVSGLIDLGELALEMMRAGEKAGGDARGLQSSALLVRKMTGSQHNYVPAEIDIRVDEHSKPLAELDRILELATSELRFRQIA